jgi:hypothetical protein
MAEDCEKSAAELGFDLTKQFLTLAFAGIAFVVGLSFNTPGAVSSLMLWLVITAFGGSAVLGLFFLMHGVNLLGIQKSYNIYASSLRYLAGFQIIFMLVGTVLLGTVLKSHTTAVTPMTHSVQIKLDSTRTVVYPIDATKNTTIEIDTAKDATIEVNGEKVKITTPKQ